MPKANKPMNGSAIASFILGLFFWMWLFNFFLGAAAVYLGMKGLRRIRDEGLKSGRNFALAGIVLGTLPFYFGAVYLLWNLFKIPASVLGAVVIALPPVAIVLLLVLLRKHRLV